MDDVVKAAAVLLGPAGIWFGWWLSERSEGKRHARAERAEADREVRARVATTAREARRFAGEALGFAHSVYLARTRRAELTDADRESVGRANEAWRVLQATLAEAAVFGPAWLDEASAEFVEAGRAYMATIARLQTNFTAADVTLVQDQLKELDAAHAAMLERARLELSG